MRPLVAHALCSALIVIGAIVGCQQAPATAPPTVEAKDTAATGSRQAAFSADRAWEHLRVLTQNGSRSIDTAGNAKARDYIREQLEKLNLEVEIDEINIMAPATPEAELDESPSLFLRNISATIPGEQGSGSIVLMAPYDTQHFDEFDFIGANDGGSGAAVLLELGRVIAADPLPYATELIFIDGHAPFSPPASNGARMRGLGFGRLAHVKKAQNVSDVHLVVYLNQVGDADLRIVRDLLSHRVYREKFFEAAQRLGQTDAFQPDAPFESSGLKFRPLSQVGLRRIVSIVDVSFGGDERPGLYAGTEQDTMEQCSQESLGTVGGVVLEGLEAISQWLIKIERFSQLPLEAPMPIKVETEIEIETETETAPEPEAEPEPEAAEATVDATQD